MDPKQIIEFLKSKDCIALDITEFPELTKSTHLMLRKDIHRAVILRYEGLFDDAYWIETWYQNEPDPIKHGYFKTLEQLNTVYKTLELYWNTCESLPVCS